MTADSRSSLTPSPAATLDFEPWLGRRVILRVAFAEVCVPLPGTLLSETASALRFRIGDGWDVDIFKNMVMAIEPETWTEIT
ncbi:MAG TPA: hypothetical protein VLW54_14620 [Candidatus Acidoferrales bacterium]|nr:hypothetical protein [Candidatus Acidoferrales bacterium]